MTDTLLTYERILDSFLAWAAAEPALRAAAVIGSRARSDHPADQWSDLDLLLFVTDMQPFVDDERWAGQMGPVWLSFLERTPDGAAWERRVLYAGGLDVDFALNPDVWLSSMVANGIPPEMADVMRRGYRVLVDKDGLLDKLGRMELPDRPLLQQPAQAEYLNAVHDFWYHTLWTARHLRRGELWWAKSGCDGRLKALLHPMLEWHTLATKGPAVDTWMRGRFLEEWADARAVAELRHCFAHYDQQDIARALLATMDTFRWLAVETAAAWQYSYPEAAEQEITKLVLETIAPLTAAAINERNE